ncbi:MAG TPA: hypothetical protein VF590_16460, partial [Isosphaeraceae bacterium]
MDSHRAPHRSVSGLPALIALAVLTLGTASGAAEAPTFRRDVAPILQRSCQECHRRGQVGPFPPRCIITPAASPRPNAPASACTS